MKTSSKGIELIKRHEGYSAKAYLCPAGIWTIGYGHTQGVKRGDVISEFQATEYLKQDIAWAERAVISKLNRLRQNQFDALVSFVFNVGQGNFNSSTLLKRATVNPDDGAIAGEFAKWNKARVNGVLRVLPGLTKRRAEEARLYNL